MAAGIYATGLTLQFGTSAIYHRVWWRTARAHACMRHADHAAIFVCIAATYTPFALLVLHGWLGVVILVAAWTARRPASCASWRWPGAPRWIAVAAYLLLGWLAIPAAPWLIDSLGWRPLPVLGGGLLYTAGAIVYARRRPGSGAGVLRLPRGLPCPGGGRGGADVRRDRVRRRARRSLRIVLTGATMAPWQWVRARPPRAGRRRPPHRRRPRRGASSCSPRQDCCLSAQEIHDRLRDERPRGRPRQRLPGARRAHPARAHAPRRRRRHRLPTSPPHPSGEHHHHAICDRCGKMDAFEDEELER